MPTPAKDATMRSTINGLRRDHSISARIMQIPRVSGDEFQRDAVRPDGKSYRSREAEKRRLDGERMKNGCQADGHPAESARVEPAARSMPPEPVISAWEPGSAAQPPHGSSARSRPKLRQWRRPWPQ